MSAGRCGFSNYSSYLLHDGVKRNISRQASIEIHGVHFVAVVRDICQLVVQLRFPAGSYS